MTIIKYNVRLFIGTFSSCFPSGFIHGDCTTRNVLLKTDSNSNWINSFVLLDFDDAVFSCLVYDVATTVTSILEEELTSRWSKVALFLKGYETQRSLTSKEKNVLYYCVTARIAQVLVGDQFMASSSDDHLPYILQSAGWKLLDDLCNKSKVFLKTREL